MGSYPVFRDRVISKANSRYGLYSMLDSVTATDVMRLPVPWPLLVLPA